MGSEGKGKSPNCRKRLPAKERPEVLGKAEHRLVTQRPARNSKASSWLSLSALGFGTETDLQQCFAALSLVSVGRCTCQDTAGSVRFDYGISVVRIMVFRLFGSSMQFVGSVHNVLGVLVTTTQQH